MTHPLVGLVAEALGVTPAALDAFLWPFLRVHGPSPGHYRTRLHRVPLGAPEEAEECKCLPRLITGPSNPTGHMLFPTSTAEDCQPQV